MTYWQFKEPYCGLSGFGSGVKSDLPFGGNWGLKHLAEGGKNRVKFGVVKLFHFKNFAPQIFVSSKQRAELEESPHDGDVHLHREITMENAGEHGYAMFSEGEWTIASATATLFL